MDYGSRFDFSNKQVSYFFSLNSASLVVSPCRLFKCVFLSFILTGLESQPTLTPIEDATALTERHFMQALQQMNLWQTRALEATSEGYETMTVSSTPLCEVMTEIMLTLNSFCVTVKTE